MDQRATQAIDASVPGARADEMLADIEHLAELHRVTVDDVTVCWRRFGRGAPLVLIHGGHGSWMHWVRNVEALAQHASVWVPELPGYGDSAVPSGAGMAGVLGPLLASLDVLVGAGGEVDVVGFSFGGLVAATMATRRAGVRSLALLGPAGHGGVRRPRGELQSWRRAAATGDSAGVADVMRHNLGVHMLHDASGIDELAVKVHTDSCLRTRFRSKDISRAGGLADALGRYPGPMLLAWGEHDVTAEPHEVAAMLARGRGNCETHVVPDAGHWVQFERAAYVNRLLVDWLAGRQGVQAIQQ